MSVTRASAGSASQTSDPSRTGTIIIGAGISGLTAAYSLQQKGESVRVLHDGTQPGGAMRTVYKDGWTLETGPNTVVVTNTYLKEMLEELDLQDDIIEASPAAKNRYIVRNKTLMPLPSSPVAFFKSSLFSTRAKLRLLREPFIRPGTDEEESLGHFVRRRLGQEFLDYAINPFVAGVYAGDPNQLSTRLAFPMLNVLEQKYGSLIKGQFRIKPEDRKPGDLPRASAPMITFTKGNKQLIDRLAAALGTALQPEARVSRITKNGMESYTAELEDGRKIEAGRIILTIPLHALKNIEWKGFEEQKGHPGQLPEVEYPPLAVVHLGYRRKQVAHALDGFGMLVPEVEHMQILGCLFNSSLFPNRTPDDDEFVLLTCFVGGKRNASFARESEEQIIARATHDAGLLLGIKSEPVMQHVTRWEKAIPQYNPAYKKIYDQLSRLEEDHKGLHFLGNFRNGISVPDCVRNARRLAAELQKVNGE